ncbi:MAG: hypothetical protein K8H86_15890, partial [Ignavibacteriaceae bacterium]|nr:hypothetical protein [Ignavibacteriaceae bacterium]
FTYAYDNAPCDECYTVQTEKNEFSITKTDDGCGVLCYCNCCNQVSVLSLMLVQNICDNYFAHIVSRSTQNLSDYSSSHWQPPKVLEYNLNQ